MFTYDFWCSNVIFGDFLLYIVNKDVKLENCKKDFGFKNREVEDMSVYKMLFLEYSYVEIRRDKFEWGEFLSFYRKMLYKIILSVLVFR